MNFLGYSRPDGRIGIRNHILILPASVCASDTAQIVANQVQGAVTFHNQNGCSQVAPDQKLTMDTMAGFAANPNIYATVIISLGCENCQMDLVEQEIKKRTNKPIRKVIIQKAGGTLKAVEQAVRYAKELAEEASMQQRIECPLSKLIVGTECGGSDPTSGLASNPLVGQFCDFLVDQGGTAILSETTEMIGAEHILARRACDDTVKKRILEIIRRYEASMQLIGEEIRNGNPSPGNIAGGISTLEEKSLGCIHKSGHRPIQAVYDYAQQIETNGLVIMDTPGNDPSSVAGMVAGGAQLILFTTGRGTPTGNPIAPVIKITANQQTYEKMSDNLDFDASTLIQHPNTISSCLDDLIELTHQVANGRQTKSESLGLMEIAIARVCNYV